MSRYKNNKDGTLSIIAGVGDTSALANKADISSLSLSGTTNTSGNTISAGTYFYLNGSLAKAKLDIASGATFTLDTNYEAVTVGSELKALNSNIGESPIYISDQSAVDANNLSTTNFTKKTYVSAGLPSNISNFPTGVGAGDEITLIWIPTWNVQFRGYQLLIRSNGYTSWKVFIRGKGSSWTGWTSIFG